MGILLPYLGLLLINNLQKFTYYGKKTHAIKGQIVNVFVVRKELLSDDFFN